jgi:hypothetical protein
MSDLRSSKDRSFRGVAMTATAVGAGEGDSHAATL